eukprot:TRINITY_DN16472_c0_g1_i4.p1 TRINITY_DN16472_c0_g1~~TRINITY_DN16472_c0_g1_i4.p1  ORF type:complete len:354 (+),score=56.28 TRINITY_DN16472_c0_g1_i4:77-1138(+)
MISRQSRTIFRGSMLHVLEFPVVGQSVVVTVPLRFLAPMSSPKRLKFSHSPKPLASHFSTKAHAKTESEEKEAPLNHGGEGDPEPKSQLSPEQLKRMETNKSLANARRVQKACVEIVAKARGQGILFPKLENLLIEKSWLNVLHEEIQKPYMQRLSEFLQEEAKGRFPIYPPSNLIFNALNICPFDKVKVVILGQDPYHGPGQAMGLCFSVPKQIKMPSSLVNIFKEINEDIGQPLPSHGDLERWAIQGVLLLNTVLTVREQQANSHAKKGWETFTDALIKTLSLRKKGIVFVLWGKAAQEKIRIIDTSKHHVLKAAHPSGLSAHRGFFKCRHFSKINKILEQSGLSPIDWQN